MHKANPAMSAGCDALLCWSCSWEGAHRLLRKDSGGEVNAQHDVLNNHGLEERSWGSKIT